MGIDYGFGRTNIDHATGIRFGVIPANDLGEGWYESAEPHYGEPHCPKCGHEAQGVAGALQDYNDGTRDGDDAELTALHDWSCEDYGCGHCGVYFGSDEAFGDEALGYALESDGYVATQSGDDCDVFIVKAPYFTYAEFCSPCAPGACYLRSPIFSADEAADELGTFGIAGRKAHDGNRAYCFGHDWFEGNVAPYPVYSVATGELVSPAV